MEQLAEEEKNKIRGKKKEGTLREVLSFLIRPRRW